MSIVPFPTAERRIWACVCGGLTHFVYEDGAQECVSCGAEKPRGEWRDRPEMADTPEDVKISFRGEPDEVGLQRMLRDAKRPDTLGIFLALKDGRVRSRCIHPDTDEDREWWRRRLADFADQIGVKL